MPDEPLCISPKSASLRAYQSQAFEVTLGGQSAENVQWSIEPNVGTIANGVYTAPRSVRIGKRVTVTATMNGRTANAEVEVTSVSFWTQVLGAYWILLAIVLVRVLIGQWSNLCPNCKSPEVAITPAVVTLTPKQQQQFTANRPVTWANPVTATGLYIAAAEAKAGETATITATDAADPKKIGSAAVIFSDKGSLAVYPQSPTIAVNETTDLLSIPATSDLEWLPPAVGNMDKSKYKAPSFVKCPQVVTIIAQTRSEPRRIAATYVTVVPTPGSSQDGADGFAQSARPLGLIALMGALGAMVHGASSFAIFVGNQQLRTSWLWWYFLRPVIGALVALVFYLVYRAGWGGNDLSLATADCMKIAAAGGLIGLFAEQASLKLKDVFETIFTPKNDPRKDPASGSGKAAPAPHIDKVTPSTIPHGSEALELLINGSNFADGCKVTVNEAARKVTSVTPTEIKAALTVEDVATARTLIVKVVSASGVASNGVTVTVT